MKKHRMKGLWLVAGTVLGLASVAKGQPAPPTARAELRNTAGEIIGQATLSMEAEAVVITLEAQKLPPGPHGFHIHEVGTCEAPEFTTAGGHFNPAGKQHGLRNPGGPHAGDLPNLVVGPDGLVRIRVMAPRVTLAAGPNSLFHPAGTALVIHAGPDDDVADPAGNSGARIACGVIVR
jgi:superoxide dismutase, Cu-Zn family